MYSFENKVVYQIYPKSFKDSNGDGIGDIRGIISKLDYFKDLGVDYLWLSPINMSPQYDNGYDISDYYEIDPMFGTKEDYKNLIDEAQRRNINIMLDLVLNHTSSEHIWFKKALEGDEKYQKYYIFTDEPNDLEGYFSESAWTYSEEVGKYYFHLFAKEQPDLNWENEEVRQEIYKMVNYWIDLGVKGFRLDVIDLIGKEPFKKITGKGPRFLEYLKELQNTTFKKDILTVGECWNSSLEEAKQMCGPDGLVQIFHFNHLILTNSPGDKFIQLKLDYQKVLDVLKKWNNEYKGSQTIVQNNHDMPRLNSLWFRNLNEYNYEKSTNLATLFSFLRGTQYIYQGEEIGMTNLDLDDLSKYNDLETLNYYEKYKDKVTHEELMERIKLVGRDNARSVMQWDSSENSGFSNVKPWTNVGSNYKQINVQNNLNSQKSVYKYYRELLKFKKENYSKLIDKDIEYANFVDDVIIMRKGNLIIVNNMSDKIKDYEQEGEILFNNYENYTNKLQPYQSLVFSI